MKNLIPSVPCNLDGTERQLYFDVNAHIAFEEAIGTTLLESMQGISQELRTAEAEGRPAKMPSVRMIRTLLWCGLRSETLDKDGHETERTLSEHQIGSMLDFGSLMSHLQQIGEAFSKAMEGLPEASRNPPKAPRQTRSRSTGSSSGASHTNSGLAVAGSSD
jgi:hypothetical protein